MMKHFAITSLLLAVVFLQSSWSAPRARMHARQGLWCSYLRGQLIPLSQASSCNHGHIATPCGALCNKGPGDICGGSGGRRLSQYGQCAEGLQCSDCNRCTGCSYTLFRCFSDTDKCVSASDIIL